MDIQQLLSTGAVVAIVTYVCNWFFYSKNKGTDFVFDYKKYILNKRIKAYETVEKVFKVDLDPLRKSGYISYKEPGESEGQQVSLKLRATIVSAQSQHVWLSYQMNSAITELRATAENLPPSIDTPILSDRVNGHVKIIGFLKALKNVQTAYFNDIIGLNDVGGFYKHVTNRSTMLQSLDGRFNELIKDAENNQAAYNASQTERALLKSEFNELENELNDLKKNIIHTSSPELQIKINTLSEKTELMKARLEDLQP